MYLAKFIVAQVQEVVCVCFPSLKLELFSEDGRRKDRDKTKSYTAKVIVRSDQKGSQNVVCIFKGLDVLKHLSTEVLLESVKRAVLMNWSTIWQS